MKLSKEEIIEDIVKRLGSWADLSPYERVLIQYVVESTLKAVKK